MHRYTFTTIALLMVLAPLVSTGGVRTASTVSRPGLDARSSIVIAAVGDIMMPGSLQAAVAKHAYNYHILFDRIAPDLGDADITFANLETPIDQKTAVAGYPAFNARPELLVALKSAGVDVLSLANNHAMDAGAAGLTRTLENIAAAKLMVIGAGKTRAEAREPVYISSRGVTTAFLAYTYGTNCGIPKKKRNMPVVNILRPGAQDELTAAASQVKKTRARADLIVVSLHWGNEYEGIPTSWQKEVAGVLIEAGADLILGHHPHVLQPIESYAAEDGRVGLIAYSLGNFISAQNYGVSFRNKTNVRGLRGDAIILMIYIVKERGITTISRAEYLPLWSQRDKVGTATLLRPISLSREITKLASNTNRTAEEENAMQLLSYRRKVILDMLGEGIRR